MGSFHETSNGYRPVENGHMVLKHSPCRPCLGASLPWLDIRVFYVRVSKCKINDSTPEYLTLNHIPLSSDTLLEVNGVRTSIYSDGASSLLRRNRLDKKSDEATFVCTDSIQMTGSVKFHVSDWETLLLSGTLESCDSNGFIGESENSHRRWILNCESDITSGSAFSKGKQHLNSDSGSPTIEVYVAGSFLGTPIILTETLQLGLRKKQNKGVLDAIPEYEAAGSSGHAMQLSSYPTNLREQEDFRNMFSEGEPFEGEDGELSWFNAGVRVGVGIGLSICVGIGLGVGLIVRTYQGTTRNFRRRLF